MTDPRTSKLADILVNYSTEVQPGDWVLVQGDVTALPLVNEVTKLVLRAGGHPEIRLLSDELQEIMLQEGSDAQIGWLSPIDELLAAKVDVRIAVRGASNTRGLTAVAPHKQQIASKVRGITQRQFMERTAEGTHRWVGTMFPCPAFAQDADMSLREYEDFVYGATYADQDDPVACWHEIHAMQQRIIDWLKGHEKIEVRGPNIDLTLSIKDRVWINSDGKRNMPSGEIFTRASGGVGQRLGALYLPGDSGWARSGGCRVHL